jgi:hypothetical protein
MSALRKLLDDLERIGDDHEELFDSEVRDAMGLAIFTAVIRPEPGAEFPTDYGMESAKANASVARAIAAYCDSVRHEFQGLSFKERLAAFQDPEVVTEEGNEFDDFFGWANPDDFDDEGNVIAR